MDDGDTLYDLTIGAFVIGTADAVNAGIIVHKTAMVRQSDNNFIIPCFPLLIMFYSLLLLTWVPAAAALTAAAAGGPPLPRGGWIYFSDRCAHRRQSG